MTSIEYGTLTDYTTGEELRPATRDEWLASLSGGETGAFKDADGRAVFVAGGPETAADDKEATVDQLVALDRAVNDLRRGPILVWHGLTGAVQVVLYPASFGGPETVLEDLGAVRVTDREYGPWDDTYWTAAALLAEQHGWHIDPARAPDGLRERAPWTRAVADPAVHLACIDRARSGDAIRRTAAAWTATGADPELVGIEMQDGGSVAVYR